MPRIEWDRAYATGIPIIDQQHKTLVGIINRLQDKVDSDSARGALEEILAELDHYAHYHFRTEEDMMAKSEYPKMDSHVNEHVQFINAIMKFDVDRLFNSEKVQEEILSFLKKWLLHHIKNVDKEFGSHLMDSEEA